MSDSIRNSSKHIKLFIPGPVEVRPKILDAQTNWMIGHRMPECAVLMKGVTEKLQQVFFTKNRVFTVAGTGSLFWEGASRNCVSKKVLHASNGAFSKKWAEVSAENGKAVDVVKAEWGQPILPELLIDKLATGEYDAVAIVHNETSTGVTSPIKEIAQAIRALPNGNDIIIMVDSVSGFSGIELRVDEWDLDIVLTSSQKALALPAGLAICAVSDRAMEKAKTIPNRGYYTNFTEIDKNYQKNETLTTTPVSLIYALDVQLDDILEEGIENRWQRHIAQRDMTIDFVTKHGFALYGDLAYASPTVSNFANSREISIKALNTFLRTKGMFLSNGYGQLKDVAFRIAHMGDIYASDLDELFSAMDDYFATL